MQILETPKVHPVIVIGSGASGGMAAWNLTRQGIDVLLLDAGDEVRPGEVLDPRAALGVARADAPRARSRREFFLDTKEQPYLTPEDRPFELVRVWGHGGKTNVWGRVSPALLRPRLQGRRARTAGRSPGRSPTRTSPPTTTRSTSSSASAAATTTRTRCPAASSTCRRPRPRCGERLLQKAAASAGHPHRGRPPRQHDARPPRLPRLPLLRQLRPRAATPRRSSARPTTCCPSPSRRASSRSGRTRWRRGSWWTTRAWPRACSTSTARPARSARSWARSWWWRASCMDSTRILLNSQVERYPNGIGNGSDVIGRYLCEQIRFHVARLPARALRHARRATTSASAASTSTCRASTTAPGHKRDYLRGFGMQFWNTGCSADRRGHVAATASRASGPRSRRRSSGATRPGSRCTPTARCCPTPHNRVTVDESPDRPLRRAPDEDRLPHRRERAEDGRAHVRHGRGDRASAAGAELVDFKRGELDKQRLRHPRARHLPHGRRTRSARP